MSWIDVTYHVRASAADIESAAAALALEQSVEVPAAVVRDPWVREHVMGRIASIEPLDAGRFRVGIRLATLTTGHDAAQAINMLFGNSSLHEHVELVDADFPQDFVAAFSGPRHGIDGIDHQIQKDLLHLMGINVDRRQIRIKVFLDLNSLPHEFRDLRQEAPNRYFLVHTNVRNISRELLTFRHC